MNNKTKRIIYYSSTSLLTLLMTASAGMYFFKHDVAVAAFTALGYPTYLIYPLAIAKLLGLVAIWTKKSERLKEWAYAGFFFDMVLALVAHLQTGDGEYGPAILGLGMLLISIVYEKKLS